ncbi:MAG: 3-hydroxyacyl-ACP dehydratase [Flavobacteriales bacterium]|nr:hypothetical protein [Bacteroidales bacterium AH-315-I05]PCJ85258.1 MAG: 3-hydroxyacyl-ACP dehydratase [Flavobacteriales bacterium]
MLGDFYTLIELQGDGIGQAKAKIELNPNHDIFKGHFPGNPIAPGVCMMQIIKEITEKVLNKDLFMYRGDNIKFMAKINPEVNPVLNLDFEIKQKEDNTYGVSCITHFEDTVFLKFKGSFK